MYNKCHTTPSNNMVSQQTDQIMLPYQINLFLISSTLVLQDNVFLFCFVVVFTFLMDFLRRVNAGISLPSWLVYILACLSSFLMPSLYTCFTIAFVQCQSFFQHLFSFFFLNFFFSPEWAFSEGGLFVLQPGSQLFIGSAVSFSLCSV